MRDVEFEGKKFEFPDDATDSEISGVLNKSSAATWWKTIQSIPQTAIGQAQEGIGGQIEHAGEALSGPPVAQLLQAGIQRLDKGETAKVGKGMAESGEINVEEAHPGTMTYWQRAVQGGGSSALAQIPAIAASLVTKSPLPMVGAAGIQQAGQDYHESREKGSDVKSAEGHAAIGGAAEAVLEMLPAEFLVHNVGGPILKTMVGTLLREVPTEVATTAIQSANSRLRDKELTGEPVDWKAYGQDLLDTIGSTMVAAPLTGGLAKGMDVLSQPQSKLNTPKIDALDLRSQAAKEGGDNSDLSTQTPAVPLFDQPTTLPDAKGKDDIQALIDSIDADLLKDEDIALAHETIQKHEESLKISPQAEASWLPLQAAPSGDSDLGDAQLGATDKQAANAVNYTNPNKGDRLDRPFLYGPEEAVGRTPRQVEMKPGTYTLGQASEDRGADYLKSVHDTVEQWRQKYLPNSTVVVSNEGLFSNAALGWHYQMGPNMHLIVPAVLRSPSKGLGSYNVNTQASAFYNLSHEFGHALVLDRFFGAMAPEVAQAIRQQSQQGVVLADAVTTLTEPQKAVIHEFNTLKQAILANKLSAQQFLDVWFSPGKLAQKTFLEKLGVAPTDNAMAVVDKLVQRAVANSSAKGAKAKQLKQQLLNDFLSLDEYLAEQTARYAYKAKLDQTSPLGQFFKSALDSLRNFFIGLKKDGSIAPGTAFTEWVEGLSKSERALNIGDKVAQAKKKGGKPVATPAAATQPKKKATPKKRVVKVQHNVETDTTLPKEKQARTLLTNLVKQKIIEVNGPEWKEMQQYIKEQAWDEFVDSFQRYAGKTVKFELDSSDSETFRSMVEDSSAMRAGIPEELLTPKLIAEAHKEWKENQFRSKFFKAWFGDWENEPEKASKVRRGAVLETSNAMSNLQLDDHMKNLDELSFGGEPLVVYHGSQINRTASGQQVPLFEAFGRGDVGFHFGTLRAAHSRIQAYEPNEPGYYPGVNEGKFIMPVVLNIRSPLVMNEDLGLWSRGAILGYLRRSGIIDLGEYTRAKEILAPEGMRLVSGELYEKQAPMREYLKSLGFDGIIYTNTVEDPGSISFVAFYPNQVKSLTGSRTFSRSDNLHMELDYDASEQEGVQARNLFESLKNFVTDKARFRRWLRRTQHLAFHTLQLQQLAHLNPDVQELAFMNEKNGEYNRYKSRLQAHADAVLSEWNSLGNDNWTKLNKFLLEESEGKELWWDLAKTQVLRDGRPTIWYEYAPNAKTAEMAAKYGLDEDLTTLALSIKNVLLNQLNEAEQALLSVLGKRYANAGPQVLRSAFIPVKRHIQELRKSPFFPQGRFGNRVLIVEKEKADGGWEIVWREHFEDAGEWEKAYRKALARSKADERIRKEELTDQSYVLMALPTDFVDMAASELGLSDEQLETLMNILQPVRREKALATYEQQRLGIKGYTSDAMRSFSNFTWHNANLLAKLIYRADFNWAIRGVSAKLRDAKYSQDPESIAQVERLQSIKSYMERTRDYIMSPPNEAQALRAAVSIGYLGLNVKTAVLNLYGLVTTWSDLTSRMGQIQGNKLFLQSTLEALRSIKLTNLNERRAGEYLSPEKQQALDKALEEGVLSQSYAYHLAGMANAGNLYRLPGRQLLGAVSKNAVDAAMYIFRLTELSTRRASFLAEFEAARKNGKLSPQEAYELAVGNTNKLQNDYSLGNRVPFMRGFKLDKGNPLGKVVEPIVPLATIFMTFAQHMAFHAYGGYEMGERRMAKQLGETPRTIWGGYTMKIWLVTLLLAGYEGLPGMENFLDLLEAAWRKIGGAKPIRQELRELVQTLEVDPQLAARGFGHNLAGFDVSRSLGFGRFVPGTDSLAHPRDSQEEQIGSLVLDLAGPAGGFIKFGLEALNPNKSKAEAFSKLPGGMGNIYTAYRWSQQGVRAPTGAQITHDLETGKLRDLTAYEIAGKALGFNPAIVSQNREIRFEQYDRKVYWEARRKMLVDDLWKARVEKDREAEKDAKTAIVEYNASVPAEYKSLRLSGADIHRSLQARQKIMRADESQVSPQRKYRPLYEDVRQSYDQP